MVFGARQKGERMSLFRRERSRLRLPVVAFAGTLFAFQALALIGATVASAAANCTFTGGTVSITLSADTDSAEVSVDANEQIVVDLNGGGFAACTGTGFATLSNITAINVAGGAGDQTVFIDLMDTTGATFDWGAINWTLSGGGDGTDGDNLGIQNDGDDSIDVTLGASGIDLNTDGDLDVVQSGFENFTVLDAFGESTINAAGDTTTGAAFASDIAGWSGNGCSGDDGICANGADGFYTGGAGDDTIIAAADVDNTFAGGLGDDSMEGDSGIVDYSASATAVTANLDTGLATGEGTDNLTGIDDVIGSAQGDTLTGNGSDNVITPGAGDDTVDCNGADVNDTVDFSTAAAGVTVDLDAGTATGDGTDTITDCVDVFGSDLADTITGDASDNELFGGGGNDVLKGGDGVDDGADTLDGEAGSDWVDYSDRTDPVSVDLTDNGAAGFPAGDNIDGESGEGDAVNAENAALGTGDDTFIGNAFNNTVQPGGGQNVLSGGTGSDTIDYSVGYEAGVTVNLAGGAASDDAIDLFENVIGTTFADSITGDDSSNTLKARAGNDNVRGGAGDDTVKAGAGNDLVRGGTGDDDLWGQKGNDALNGGKGSDFCKGGPGKDTLKSCESGHK
jgi:Ca2+-binding RTX toxin-like protein